MFRTGRRRIGYPNGVYRIRLAKLSKYEIKRGRQNSFLETTTHMQLKNVYENMYPVN